MDSAIHAVVSIDATDTRSKFIGTMATTGHLLVHHIINGAYVEHLYTRRIVATVGDVVHIVYLF